MAHMHEMLKTYNNNMYICFMNQIYVLQLCLQSTAFIFEGISMQFSLYANLHSQTYGILTVFDF